MKKALSVAISFITLVMLLVACSKKEELLIKPIQAYKPFTMGGFVLGEKLEQYFDGVKVKDLYQLISSNGPIAFDKDETVMELRIKGTGEKVYEQKFFKSDSENKVPNFYFDGKQIHAAYTYPAPVGSEYKANFYFDFPADSGKLDVVAEIIEYYYDPTLPNPTVFVGSHPVTIATGIEPGKWSDYITLTELPVFPPSRPDSQFWQYICVKKTGKPGYITSDKMEENEFPLEFPQSWTTDGKVQSIYVGWTKTETRIMLSPQQDLVQLFP